MNLATGVVVVAVVAWLAWSLAGSRLNLAMATFRGLDGDRRRRLLWTCSDCDMTGNESAVCPGCGRQRDWG